MKADSWLFPSEDVLGSRDYTGFALLSMEVLGGAGREPSGIPLQLLAHHAAVARGCNADTLRKRGEYVTVEE